MIDRHNTFAGVCIPNWNHFFRVQVSQNPDRLVSSQVWEYHSFLAGRHSIKNVVNRVIYIRADMANLFVVHFAIKDSLAFINVLIINKITQRQIYPPVSPEIISEFFQYIEETGS